MKLLDKIALQRLISMILNFILAVLKLVVPKPTDNDSAKPKRRRIFPRVKK